jgi:hypothetical protein
MEIKKLITRVISDKLEKYEQETVSSPFFSALFSEKSVKLASLMQSFYTSLGMSVYEPMAVILVREAGFHAERQFKILGEIDSDTENLITKLHLELKRSTPANKSRETEAIRNSIKQGRALVDPDCIADVFVRKPTGEEYYFDITSARVAN